MINGDDRKNIDLIDLEITYKLRKYYKDKNKNIWKSIY